MQDKVKREVKAMRGIEHPHVVSLIQVIDTPADIFLVLELAAHGDLYDKIINSGRVSNLTFDLCLKLLFLLRM